jgi:hypothetical protein
MNTLSTPASTFGRHPLKGATPVAWRSQFRGVCCVAPLLIAEVPSC